MVEYTSVWACTIAAYHPWFPSTHGIAGYIVDAMNTYMCVFPSMPSPDPQILCGKQVYLCDEEKTTGVLGGWRYQGIIVKSSDLDPSSCLFLTASF